MTVVKTFEGYPAEILNGNAKSWIGESRRIRTKTNKTSLSNPNCHMVRVSSEKVDLIG